MNTDEMIINFNNKKMAIAIFLFYAAHRIQSIHLTRLPAINITSNQIHHWIRIVFQFLTLSSFQAAVRIWNQPHKAYATARIYKKVIRFQIYHCKAVSNCLSSHIISSVALLVQNLSALTFK